MSDYSELLKKYNLFLCYILFTPIAMSLTLIFFILDLILVPIGYIGLIIGLIQTLLDNDETMDEFEEKVQRVFTILKFIVSGLFILLFSVFIDSYNFFINLFYEPDFHE